MTAPALVFRGAGVRLGARMIWRDLNAEIESGEFVAILGPNGVGKSALIKVVVGLIPTAEGEVEVLGSPPGGHNREIGYLPQRRSFEPDLRVRGIDIVRLGLDGDRWGLPSDPSVVATAGGAKRRASKRSSSSLAPAHSPTGRSGECPEGSSSGC